MNTALAKSSLPLRQKTSRQGDGDLHQRHDQGCHSEQRLCHGGEKITGPRGSGKAVCQDERWAMGECREGRARVLMEPRGTSGGWNDSRVSAIRRPLVLE